jgi:hypothetical protein
MSIQDFAKKKSTAPAVGGGLIKAFVNKNNTSGGIIPTSTPQTFASTPITATEKNPQSSLFRTIGKQLMKPQGVTMKELRGVGEGIGYLIKGQPGKSLSNFIQRQKEALDVVRGKEETSYSKELEKVVPKKEQDAIFKTLTLAGDFVVDPLNFIEPAKIAQAIGKTTGLSKVVGAVSKGIKETEGFKTARSLFSNTTGVKEFDEVVGKFRNMGDYRLGEIKKLSVDLQKNIGKYGPEAEDFITEALENPKSIETAAIAGKEELVGEVNKLKTTYQDMLKKANEVGLTINEIKDYAPHIRTKESFGNTLAKMFNTGSAEFGKGAVEKGRKIIKLVGEDGSVALTDWTKTGLRRINKEVFIDKLEKETSTRVAQLNKIREKLASKEINLFTGDLQNEISALKKNISSPPQITGSVNSLIEPTAEEYDQIIKSMVYPIRDELNQKILELETLVRTSAGKEFLKSPIGFKNSREAKIKWLTDEITKSQNDLTNSIQKIQQYDFIGGKNKLYKSGTATIKELGERGVDIFEKNPAIQLAKKGQMYAKAITSAEFANEVKKFAIPDGVAVTNSLLKDHKFAPELAKVIDNYYQRINPKELNVIFRTFDKIQNIWKAQALVAPSYHIRNEGGNLWNNFLAGVGPDGYKEATVIQLASKTKEGLKKYAPIVDEMKKLGVIDEGWYSADIAEDVMKTAGEAKTTIGGIAKKLNPLSQDFFAYKANKAVGSVMENNARMAHYLSKKAQGLSPEKAAESVRKYLFDYGDLTTFERTVMKRIFPFYTWTRKNLPIQLEALFTQPAKVVLPYKVINDIESGVKKPDERWMTDYIKSNVPVRIRTDKDGNTEYFLLGNWLPYASAIDVLSEPMRTLIGMVTPGIKAPLEAFSNKSLYFKDTLGNPAPIERRGMQQGEFLGQSMRKRNINLLKNIRVLSDMDKWVGKQDKYDVKESPMVKLLNTLFGRAATYDVGKAKYFYNLDTQDKTDNYMRAIQDALKRGYKDDAHQLRQEMIKFINDRKNPE